VPEPPGEAAHVKLLLGEDERHAGVGPSGAPGSAGAVDVVVVGVGWVEVDHVCHLVDVEAARCDIGRDQRRLPARLEPKCVRDARASKRLKTGGTRTWISRRTATVNAR
jgi:hypothetical protein